MQGIVDELALGFAMCRAFHAKPANPIPGALLFALFGSDVVAGSGESDPCQFTGFNPASMGQIKKCSSDKVLKIVVAGEFGVKSMGVVYGLTCDSSTHC